MFKRILSRLAFMAFVLIAYQAFGMYQNGDFNKVMSVISPGLVKTQSKPVYLPGHSLLQAKEAADPSDCVVVRESTPIYIDPSKYPATAKHVRDAVRAGEPRVLHLDREGADENRDYSLAGIATAPGKDRDEYPPAVSMEGGEGADVRLVPSSDNRGAGSSMGAQLSGFCSGQAFVLVAAANPN